MKVTVKRHFNRRSLELKDETNLVELLEKLKVNRETVIVCIRGKIVADDERLKDGDEIEILSVISGG